MPGSDVNVRTVEVAIESSAHSALTNLEKLAAQLDSLATKIEDVVEKAGGLSTIGKGSGKGLSSASKSIEKTAKTSTEAAKQVDKFAKKISDTGFTGKSGIQKAAEESAKAITDYKEEMRRFGVDTEQKGVKFLMGEGSETAKRAKILSNRAKGYQNAADVLGERPKNQVDKDMEMISDLEGRSRKASEALAELKKRKDEALTSTSSGKSGASIVPLSEEEVLAKKSEILSSWGMLSEEVNHHMHIMELAGSVINRVKNIYRGLHEGVKFATTTINKFSRAVQMLANPLKLVSRAGQKFKEVLGIGGHGGLFGGRRTFGQFLGMMLLRRAIMSMIRALVSGIKEGSDNLAQYSADYNRSISSMSSALKYLKNAWAAAFAPIINVVAPYITAFINMLASALNAIGRFMAALTGKGFAVQAKPVWQDYADSLGSAASGAGKAAKAAKEYQKTLMSFDQIHALNSPDNSSSGGSGGGGGGGSDGLSVQDMFTTTSIEGSMKNFADKLREAAKAGNWVGVGEIIAEKLNEAFSDLTIWKNLGKKIADFFNIAIDTFYGFVKKFNFKQFGLALGTAIGTALANIHWDNLGGGIGRFATGLFEFLTGLMQGVDWKLLGSNIKTAIGAFFRELNWASIGEFVMTALDSLLDFCLGLMPDFGEIGEYILTAIGDFFDNVPDSKILAIAAKIALLLLKCAENVARFNLGIPNKIIESLFGVDLIDKAFGAVEGKLDEGIQNLEKGSGKGISLKNLFTGSHGAKESIVEFFTGTNRTIKQYAPQLEGNMLQAGKGAWEAFTKWINKKNGKTAGTDSVTGVGSGASGKSSWLNKTIGKVSSAAAKMFNVDSDTKKSGESSITSFGKGTTGKQSWITNTVRNLFKGIGSQFNINSIASTHGSSSMTYFANGANAKKAVISATIKSVASSAGSALNINSTANAYGSSAIASFSNGASGKRATVTSVITSIATGAKNALNISTAANTHGRNIGASYANGIKGAKNSVSNAGTMLSNAVSGTLSSNAYSKGYSYGSSLSKGFSAGFKSNSLPKVDYNINYTNINGNRVPTSIYPYTNYVKPYAQGGFLNSGELFLARENGLTEMIGRIGNRGAVANNQQIVEGIEAGVARGMMAALSATSNGGGNMPYEINITVKTQSDEILAKAVERGNAKRKYRLGTAMG